MTEALAAPERGRAAQSAGSIAVALDSVGRRYATVIRLLSLPVTLVVALLSADGGAAQRTVAVALGIYTVWSVTYVLLLRRRTSLWVTGLDAGQLTVLGLLTPVLVSPLWLSSGRSWLAAFAAFAVVGYQYYEAVVPGAVAAVAVCVSLTVGRLWSGQSGALADGVVSALWVAVIAALARYLWSALGNAGETADQLIRASEQARHERAFADRARAQEASISRAVHDTASATLIMVGDGAGTAALVRARARRDLSELATWRIPDADEEADLVALLRHASDYSGLRVRYDGPDRLPLAAVAAHGLASAVREALSNVRRHAGVIEADLVLMHRDEVASVVVGDN